MYLFRPGWYRSNFYRNMFHSSLSPKCCHFSQPPARNVTSTHGTHSSTQFLESLRFCTIQRLGHQRVKRISSGLIQLDHLAFFATRVSRSSAQKNFIHTVPFSHERSCQNTAHSITFGSTATGLSRVAFGATEKKAPLASDGHLLAPSTSCRYATIFHTNSSVRSSGTLGWNASAHTRLLLLRACWSGKLPLPFTILSVYFCSTRHFSFCCICYSGVTCLPLLQRLVFGFQHIPAFFFASSPTTSFHLSFVFAFLLRTSVIFLCSWAVIPLVSPD